MARKDGRDRGLFERPKGSGIWWIHYHDATGKKHRERVGPKSLARKLYEKRKTEIREARYFPPERRRPILVREILDDYRERLKTCGRSIEKGQASWRRLYETFRDKPAESVLPQEIETFKISLAESLSPAFVNHHLQILRAAYNWAARNEKIGHYPFRNVSLFKPNNIRARYLTEEEEGKLLPALPPYLRPLITVAIHTGLRRGELLTLSWNDVDFTARVITMRKSKSGYGRHIPMNDVAFETLGRLYLERSEDGAGNGRVPQAPKGLVFTGREGGYLQNLNRYWYKALRKAGLRDFRFHDLRHTFASRLVMRAVDLYTVQTLLGHRTSAMVQRYAHLSPDHLRKAVERLAPLPGSVSKYGTHLASVGNGHEKDPLR